VSAAFLTAPSAAPAKLVIKSEFLPSKPPPNLIGGGNLVDIFNAAAATWEKAFPGGQHWVLDLKYEWAPLSPGSNAQFILESQGGHPHRILSGLIQFNNTTEQVPFFADPTPDDHSEYIDYDERFTDAPGGMINDGRKFWGATGGAALGIDLLTIAAHEIGHALGLALHNTASGPEIVVTRPRPFAGLVIYTYGGDHLYDYFTLMGHSLVEPGVRVLISSLDVLVEAQISRFNHPNLDPYAVVPHWANRQPAPGGRSRGRARRAAR
jgi:hypothetical protein